MNARRLLSASLFVPAILALPPLRKWLEADMLSHMLVQFPLLIAAGICLGMQLPPAWRARCAEWNNRGMTGLLLALCVSTFWMIPLALDQALVQSWLETVKFISLTLGVGTALALSWRPAGVIVQGFFLGNVLPMLAVVGWLYLESPVRLCNAYLASQQENTGRALVWFAVLASFAWLASFFIAPGALKTSLIHSQKQHEEINSNPYRFHSTL